MYRDAGLYWVKAKYDWMGLPPPIYRGAHIARWDGGSWIIPYAPGDASGARAHTDSELVVCSQRLPDPEPT